VGAPAPDAAREAPQEAARDLGRTPGREPGGNPDGGAGAPGRAPPVGRSAEFRSALPGEGPRAEDRATLDAVNRIRFQRALRPLRWNDRLFVAARDHSREQRDHGYMGHGSPDPARETLTQRMALAAYRGSVYAEVVAWGFNQVDAVVEGWMNSRDHRVILLDAELEEAGFSRVGEYWTGNFGTPARGYDPGVHPAPGSPSPRNAPGAGGSAPRTAWLPAPDVRSGPAPAAAPAPYHGAGARASPPASLPGQAQPRSAGPPYVGPPYAGPSDPVPSPAPGSAATPRVSAAPRGNLPPPRTTTLSPGHGAGLAEPFRSPPPPAVLAPCEPPPARCAGGT
jgi:uncharacterized protein YkwD